MANVWRLTSEGRAALMDGNNRQTRAIVMRTIAIGDGSGAPSQTETENRTTLRSQRDSGAVGGQTNVAGRIAVRASITPSAAYDVTEVGVFGQIEAETPFLLAYWTDSGRVLVPATQDATTVIAGTLDLAAAAAEVMVTVSPLVSLSAVGAFADLSDTPAAFVAGNYLRANSPAADALENVTAAAVLSDLLNNIAVDKLLKTTAAGNLTGLTPVDGILADLLDVARPTPGADTKYSIQVTSGGGVSLVEFPFDPAALQSSSAAAFFDGYVTAVVVTTARPKIRIESTPNPDRLSLVRVDVGAFFADGRQAPYVLTGDLDGDTTSSDLSPGLYLVEWRDNSGRRPTTLAVSAVP